MCSRVLSDTGTPIELINGETPWEVAGSFQTAKLINFGGNGKSCAENLHIKIKNVNFVSRYIHKYKNCIMKRFLTLFSSAALAATAVGAETLFTADFASADETAFGEWTVIDGNGDGSTWKFDLNAEPSRVFYSYNSTNAGDDWLISPAITIPADGTYVLNYEFKGSSYGEAFEVYAGDGASPERMTTLLDSHSGVPDAVSGNLAFIDAKAGDMHIGFHATTPADKYRLYIISATLLRADNPVDLAVTSITAPVSGSGLGMEDVTVTVENKGRVDVEGFDIAYVLNGGEPVVERFSDKLAAGTSAEYTFTQKADLSRGHFNHTLQAYTLCDDDINPANDSASTAVYHVAPATVPYSTGFEPDEDLNGMTFLNLNNDSGDWGLNVDGWFSKFSRTGAGSLCYNYDKENDADDWAFIEPIRMEAGHYAVKYWYSATDDHKEKLRVCYGYAPTPEAMTNVIAEYNPIDNPQYLEAIHIIDLKDGGDVYFGFYAFSDKDENWLCIDDFSVSKVDADNFDVALSSLASPMSYLTAATPRDLTFNVFNAGIVDADVTFNVTADGVQTASFTETVEAQKLLTISKAEMFNGLTEGKHSVSVEAVCQGDNDASNNVLSLDVVVLPEAKLMWDFEDGQLPDGLTFRVEDTATNHPSAGDEFNEDGIGLFSIADHNLLGSNVLAVNTWFTDATRADRWIVLPQQHVNGDFAHFALTAMSFNPYVGEDNFDLCVSTGDDVYYNYSQKLEEKRIGATPCNYGIDLSEYKGEDIYVAIHVKSKDSEAIIFDNIGLYGDIAATSGIEGVSEESGAIKIADGVISGNGEINVYDMAGTLVATGVGRVDTAAFGAGAYIAKSAGSVVKFVK